MNTRVTPTELEGVLIVDIDFFRDERGFFIESYHRDNFRQAGITDGFVQDNHSRSRKGVLRGIHYQDMSAPMSKLVRCTMGAILDVAVDLRVGSPTFARWVAAELSADNMRQLLVPVGYGHAFLTLTDTADVQYKCSEVYTPSAEGGVRWDDPDIGIEWPLEAEPILSEKDRNAMTLRDYLSRPAFTYDELRAAAGAGRSS